MSVTGQNHQSFSRSDWMPHLKRGSRCINEPLARPKRQCQFVWAARVVIIDVWCRDLVRGHARMPKITKHTLLFAVRGR